MSRRVRMPAADDLFRPTAVPDPEPEQQAPASRARRSAPRAVEPAAAEPEQTSPARVKARKPSGRVRHDEKMTVYVTSDELLEIEHARLSLRREQGLAVDRGRLVREAVALVLADFEAHGADSALVRRLTQE